MPPEPIDGRRTAPVAAPRPCSAPVCRRSAKALGTPLPRALSASAERPWFASASENAGVTPGTGSMMVLDRWTAIRRTSALAPRGVHASDTPNKYYKKILEILRTVYYNELIRVRTSGSTSGLRGPRGRAPHVAQQTKPRLTTARERSGPEARARLTKLIPIPAPKLDLFSFTFTHRDLNAWPHTRRTTRPRRPMSRSVISTTYSELSLQALGDLRELQPDNEELEDEIRRRIQIKEEEIKRKEQDADAEEYESYKGPSTAYLRYNQTMQGSWAIDIYRTLKPTLWWTATVILILLYSVDTLRNKVYSVVGFLIVIYAGKKVASRLAAEKKEA